MAMLVKGGKQIDRSPEAILLTQFGDIGDVVLSLPCMRALKENFPDARLVVAVWEKARDLLEDCPWVTEAIGVSRLKRPFLTAIKYEKDFWSHMRQQRFDLAFDLRTGTRGAVMALLSGARQRIGFYAHEGEFWRNGIFTHLLNQGYDPTWHVAQYYLSLLQAYGISTDCIRPELEVPSEKNRQASVLLQGQGIPAGKKIIAIQPFSLWSYKEWDEKKYIGLIDWLQKTFQVEVVIAGSADQKERAQRIITGCSRRVFNLAGLTSMGILPAVLKRSALFIGVDSAGLHLAAAVQTPTVAIFGPSAPVSWAPLGEEHLVVSKNMPCQPCRRKGCDDTEISRCIQELTLEEVAAVVAKQLESVLEKGK